MSYILVIDDDEAIREMISMMLTDDGYIVQTANNGGVALEKIAQQQPSLILLDMLMPIVDGEEFNRRYSAMPGPHAPIVLISANRDEGATRALAMKTSGYLAKPFRLEDLLKLVQRYSRSA